eukprot:6070902-Pyramimonas_sp.AAC.1
MTLPRHKRYAQHSHGMAGGAQGVGAVSVVRPQGVAGAAYPRRQKGVCRGWGRDPSHARSPRQAWHFLDAIAGRGRRGSSSTPQG